MACVCFYLEASLRNVFGGWMQNKQNYLNLEAAILWHIQCQQKWSGRTALREWTRLFFLIYFVKNCLYAPLQVVKIWFLAVFAFYFGNISAYLKGAFQHGPLPACLWVTQIQEVLFFQTTNCYCVNCHRVCDTVTPLCHSF